jgi:hypothetical protein
MHTPPNLTGAIVIASSHTRTSLVSVQTSWWWEAADYGASFARFQGSQMQLIERLMWALMLQWPRQRQTDRQERHPTCIGACQGFNNPPFLRENSFFLRKTFQNVHRPRCTWCPHQAVTYMHPHAWTYYAYLSLDSSGTHDKPTAKIVQTLLHWRSQVQVLLPGAKPAAVGAFGVASGFATGCSREQIHAS